MTLDSVMITIDATMLAAAKNLRTRALATIRLRPATRIPATDADQGGPRVREDQHGHCRYGDEQRWPGRVPCRQSQSTTTSPSVTAA